jgi:DNA mismatch repair ATPase MutS
LEILETGNVQDSEEGSLFRYLDRTVTKFGKRMLKNIICAPLMNV